MKEGHYVCKTPPHLIIYKICGAYGGGERCAQGSFGET
jgi:hypothetical protein